MHDMKHNMLEQDHIKQIHSLWSRGARDHAQFLCAQLLARRPQSILGNVAMSQLFSEQANYRNAYVYAVRAYNAVVQSDSWGERISVSHCLLTNGENGLARELMSGIESALIQNSQDCVHVAEHFRKLDMLEESLSWFKRAASLAPLSDDAMERMAVAHIFNGQQNIAKVLLEQVLHHDPLNGHAHWLLMTCGGEINQSQIERMLIATRTVSENGDNKQFLHYALFKALDYAGDLQQAWSHLLEASKHRKIHVQHNPRFEDGGSDALIEYFSSKVSSNSFNEDLRHLFVVGMPRSGTTLVERILGNFQGVKECGELSTFRRALERQLQCNLSTPPGAIEVGKMRDINYEELGLHYKQAVSRLIKSSSISVDKHPYNAHFVGPILESLPDARVVYVQKHPVAAAFSNLKEYFGKDSYTYSYSLDDIGSYIRGFNSLMRHWKSAYPNRMLHLRYDDLVLFPNQTAARIGNFCGLPAIEFASDITLNKSATSTASTLQVREPIHDRYIHSWIKYRQFLAPLEAELHEEVDLYERCSLSEI
jgi:tetratricopeptide (TPR) repeat protein